MFLSPTDILRGPLCIEEDLTQAYLYLKQLGIRVDDNIVQMDIEVSLITALTPIQGYAQYMRETLPDESERFQRILVNCATLKNLIPEFQRVWLEMGNHPTVAKVAVEEWVNLLRQVVNCFSSVDVILHEFSEEIRRQFAEAFLNYDDWCE